MRISTILAPVDFSRSARLGIREAAAIANKFEATLLLLHAAVAAPAGDYQGGETPGVEDAYDAEGLAQLAEREAPAAKSQLMVVHGDLGESVRRVCDERNVDLVVMSTRGEGTYRQFLLGSNTAKVLHDVKCPVLTGAHLEHPAEACYPYRRIACLVDLKDDGREALRYAGEFADSVGADLTVVHIAPDFRVMGAGLHREFMQTLQSSARLRLEQLIEDEKVSAEIRVETGALEEVLPVSLREGDFDLLVLDRNSDAGPDAGGGLSASAYAAIRCSPRPVLSV
jgi:nucleotide-binding universal stress UspA family protein